MKTLPITQKNPSLKIRSGLRCGVNESTQGDNPEYFRAPGSSPIRQPLSFER